MYFVRAYLGSSKQDKSFQNAPHCGKHRRKRDIATLICDVIHGRPFFHETELKKVHFKVNEDQIVF